ncbi:MAG TPA: hypothetical protein EYG73_00670 [Arcobacter sp.]|nr:hypothetical protein [Arcobacter sp.]
MKNNYHVFISFKNSDDETEEETLDKEVAYKVYKYLSGRELNVFFSPVTLKALGRDSWSEEIDSALREAKVFIAVGTQKEYMNAEWVHKERTSFFGLKLADKSRAIYGYIASPMTLKDLPDDMKKIEIFQDRKSDVLDSLYTYIRNHLAHNKNRGLEVERRFNKNYLLIGVLILVGVFFFDSRDNGDLVEIVKEEIKEKRVIIKEQKEESKKDKRIILTQVENFERIKDKLKKEHPEILNKNPEILYEIDEIFKSYGIHGVLNYLRVIDWNEYEKKDVIEKIEDEVIVPTLLKLSQGIDDSNSSLEKNIPTSSVSDFGKLILGIRLISFVLDNNTSIQLGEAVTGVMIISNYSQLTKTVNYCTYLETKKDTQSNKICGNFEIPAFTVTTYRFEEEFFIEIEENILVSFILVDKNGIKLVEIENILMSVN